MRRNIYIMVLLLLVVFVQNKVDAQEQGAEAPMIAPIPVELFLGADGWTAQMVIDKHFSNSNNFGVFALSYLRANYDNDDFLRESVNLAMLKYMLFKNFSILSGAIVNSHWGFRPYAGAQYAYHSKTFGGMLNSGFHLTETKNFETIGMAEYRPVINKVWSFYTSVQGMYSQNTVVGKHDRSYIYSRVGVSYKTLSFGGALNYDWYGYGPMKIEDHQWGVFISTLLK